MELLSNIVAEFKLQNNLKRLLYLKASSSSLFEDLMDKADLLLLYDKKKLLNGRKCILGDPWITLDDIKEKFELIIGDLPLGIMPEKYTCETKGIKIRERKNWLTLFKSLFSLPDNGYGVYVVEPSFLGTSLGDNFNKELNKHGFYVNGLLNTPEGILRPETSIRPLIAIVSKRQTEKILIAELDEITVV